jgi:hypothetical protein
MKKTTNNVWINETMFTKEQVELFYEILPEYEEETAAHDALIAKRYATSNIDISPMTTILSCILTVLVMISVNL